MIATVLFRWADGSFTLTGWGWVAFLILLWLVFESTGGKDS